MAVALLCVAAVGTAGPADADAGAKAGPSWHVGQLGSPVPDPSSVIPVGAVSVQHNASDKQRPHVFTVVDGTMYVLWWTGGEWRWTSLHTPPSGSPIVEGVGVLTVQDSPQQMTRPYAYVRTADGHLWVVWTNTVGWNWQDLGTPPGTSVQAGVGVVGVTDTPSSSHRPYVYVLGADGGLWLNLWDGAAFRWQGFGTPQPGAFADPSTRNRVGVTLWRVTASSPDYPQAFLLDRQRNLWRHGWNGSSWSWQNHGRPPTEFAVNRGLGAVTVQGAPGQGFHPRAFVGVFGQLYVLAWTGSQYTWSATGGPGGVYLNPSGAIAVRDAPVAPQRSYVFTTDLEGGPVSASWTRMAGQWYHAEQAGTNADPGANYGGAITVKDSPILPERPYVFYWSFRGQVNPEQTQLMVNWWG